MKIDLLDPTIYREHHPYEMLGWLRENEPLYWHDEPDGAGFWVLTRHADVKAIEIDSATFSSEPLTVIPDSPPVGDADHKLLIFSDPPGHTARRKFLGVELNPGHVRTLRERIEGIVTDIIDDVIERGQCELVEEVSGRLASFVIADMMGISRTEALELFPAAEILTKGVRTDTGIGAEARQIVFEHGSRAWASRRADPGTDWLSRLAHGTFDGAAEDETYFQLDFFHLITAGSDTTRNAVASGMVALMNDRESYQALVDDPSLVPTATEEILRWGLPIGYQRRTATRDVTMYDRVIKAGDKVTGWYSAANRDPRVFDHPDVFDIRRRPNPHLAFGAGRHFCLGAHLARLEIEVVVGQLMRRIPDMELAAPLEYFDYPTAGNSGPAKVHVRFTPGPRVGPRRAVAV